MHNRREERLMQRVVSHTPSTYGRLHVFGMSDREAAGTAERLLSGRVLDRRFSAVGYVST